MAARIPERLSLRLSALGLLVLLACHARPTAKPSMQSTGDSTAAAVAMAFGAIPVDSICALLACRIVSFDPVIRLARSVGPFQVNRLPALSRIGAAALREAQSLRVELAEVSFRGLGINEDTLAFAFAIVEEPRLTASRSVEVLLFYEAPGSMGGFFAVQMEQVGEEWRVIRVRPFEG